MSEEIKKSDFIQSLEKGLNVISAFGFENEQMTITETANKVGLTRANARRVLLTLQHLGYINCTDGKKFSLSPKVLCLGYSYLSGLPFRELALPIMEELTAQLNESCSMSVLDKDEIVYVARVHTKRIMTINLAVGTRLPVYAASMGKILLAGLPENEAIQQIKDMKFEAFTEKTWTQDQLIKRLPTIREQGYAIADEEIEIGVRSIAGPIKDKNGKVVSALNISGHASRVSVEDLEKEYLPVLKHFSEKIENSLKLI